MTKLKTLFAIGRLSVGGAEKLLVNQLPVVDRGRFDPYLLTLSPEKKSATFEEKITSVSDHWKKMNFQSLFDLFAWLDLFRFLRKEKFDVVVTSLFFANLVVRIMATITRVPIIISYEHNLYPNKHRWQIWMDWILAKWTDKIIVDSGSVWKFTAEQEKIPIEKFLLMYIPPLLDMSGVRDPMIVRQELKIPKEAKIVLTVSRLVEEKGHRYLIEAAKKVLEKFPDVYFVIVGWGPLEKSLKLQAENLKLKDRVILPGKMDIRDVLPIADIYVDPAIMTDLPIAIMEAMRLERAIVSSAIGEIPVFIRNMETGLLAPPADVDLLAEKILMLLEKDELRGKLGMAAGKIASKYSLENYEKEFENLIVSIYLSKETLRT